MSISVSFLEVSILCSGFVCFVFWLEIHIISLLSASTLSPVIKNKGGQLDWEGCWGQPTTDGKYDGGGVCVHEVSFPCHYNPNDTMQQPFR